MFCHCQVVLEDYGGFSSQLSAKYRHDFPSELVLYSIHHNPQSYAVVRSNPRLNYKKCLLRTTADNLFVGGVLRTTAYSFLLLKSTAVHQNGGTLINRRTIHCKNQRLFSACTLEQHEIASNMNKLFIETE